MVDDLSTGRRENLEGATAAGARAGRARHPRRGGRGRAGRRAGRARGGLPPGGPDRRAQVGGRPAPSTRASTWRARSTCSRPPAAPACARVVNTSTGGAIYGEGQMLPAPEDHPVAPEAPYGQSKFCAEGYCELFAPPARPVDRLAALRQRLRPAPGPARRGRRDRDLLRQAAGGRAPTVFGDGLQTRDYVYVEDVVAANLLAAESDAGGAFNIGTGGRDQRARHRRGAGRLSATASFEPDLAPERPGRGAPHRARRLARQGRAGLEPRRSGSPRGSSGRSDSLR